MKIPCPSCPDGYVWNSQGGTGTTCPTCKGKAYIGEDDDDCPYCECGEQPTEEEKAENQCAACGKPYD